MADTENTKRGATEDVVVKGEPLNKGDNLAPKEAAYQNIVNTWNGGERKLAGARASELIYGSGNKPNQEVMTRLTEELQGIGEYISAPVSGTVIDTVQDKGYEPEQTPSNLSSEAAKAEQDAIDKTLQPGREAREERRDIDKDTVGDTAVNPDEEFSPLDHDKDGRRGGHFDNRGKSGKK